MIKRLDSKYEKKVIDYLNIEKEINTFNLQELKNYGFDNVFYKVYSDILLLQNFLYLHVSLLSPPN